MERTFDRLPPKFDVSKRQWVVAVGQVVRRTLRAQLGLEPSNDLIKSIVEEKKKIRLLSRPFFRKQIGLSYQSLMKKLGRLLMDDQSIKSLEGGLSIKL